MTERSILFSGKRVRGIWWWSSVPVPATGLKTGARKRGRR